MKDGFLLFYKNLPSHCIEEEVNYDPTFSINFSLLGWPFHPKLILTKAMNSKRKKCFTDFVLGLIGILFLFSSDKLKASHSLQWLGFEE